MRGLASIDLFHCVFYLYQAISIVLFRFEFMFRPFSFFLYLLFTVNFLQSQNALKSFEWRDHLAYQNASSACETSERIYVASNQCLFYINKSDQSLNRLNKINGLSDIEPVLVKCNAFNQKVVVAYKNSNLDIILSDNTIINLPFILNKQGISNKSIQSISFNGKLAYIACGFGIVVLDTDALEIKDTYIIGTNGSSLSINEVAVFSGKIYAAAANGLYEANLNNSNLADFQSWTRISTLPNLNFSSVVASSSQILASCSIFDPSNGATYFKDTIYTLNASVWQKFTGKPFGYIAQRLVMENNGSRFALIAGVSFDVFDAAGNLLFTDYGSHVPMGGYANIRELFFTPFSNGVHDLYFADMTYGLYHFQNNGGSVSSQRIHINSPNTALANKIRIQDDKLILAPIFIGDFAGPNYYGEGLYTYENSTWKTIKKIVSPSTNYFDLNTVDFDPNDKTHFYSGSFLNGLMEYRSDSAIANYISTNSTLPTINGSDPSVRVSCLTHDEDGNLYIGHYCENFAKPFTIRKTDGSFVTHNFASFTATNTGAKDLIVDENKQVWVIIPSSGILVYKNDGNFSSPNSSNTKKLTTAPGSGNLPSANIYSIAEDKDGDIWVGTDKGIAVFYSPENILSGGDAQQIFVEQDDKTQILLETELISAIAVDGANQKWLGTRSNGVYLFSPDGQKEIYHFTSDNSPLFSNSILDIEIDPKTGEVFFATEKGMISFQNTVIEGFEKFEDVYSYPNPVKPDYSGPILIHGMIHDAVVKIVDVSGNLVFETKAKGGQATWYAKNLKGERVSSGVYVVLAATKDGSEKAVTKILVIN